MAMTPERIGELRSCYVSREGVLWLDSEGLAQFRQDMREAIEEIERLQKLVPPDAEPSKAV